MMLRTVCAPDAAGRPREDASAVLRAGEGIMAFHYISFRSQYVRRGDIFDISSPSRALLIFRLTRMR